MASQFELAPESRLPEWVSLPAGTARDAVRLQLYYYTPLSNTVDDTVLVQTIGRQTQTFTARHWWHPRTQRQLDAYYATEPRPEYPRPTYVVVVANGQLDVVEHRGRREQNRDPTRALFWMATDPSILAEARESRPANERLP